VISSLGEEKRMSKRNQKHVLRGVLAGAVAGLAASWVMDQFMAGPGRKLQEAVQSDDEKIAQRLQRTREQESGKPREDATMKTADAIVALVTGGVHLSTEAKQKGGPIVHYAFGAVMGGLYGGLAECSETVTSGMGTAFGTALFAGADMVAVPAFKLSSPPCEWAPSSLVNPLAGHLVYGATTELLRRLLRAVL
jgi:putative membrane protein